jgi:hypothetical protein
MAGKRAGGLNETPPAKKSSSKQLAQAATEDVIERPTSLAEGTLVEALDVQNLWYPARVVTATASKVLLSFDGWSNDWDEWLPKSSARLREHRGWGTEQMPHDWQVDTYCLALDMQDRWCRAKILHVAEDAVQVHYTSWSSKWDEWIVKTSGRLRKLTPNGAKPTEANDTHDDVCGVCEAVGELIMCEGVCRRAFHASCIPSNNPPPLGASPGSRWVCADCRSRRFRCFVCKRWGQSRKDVHACSRKGCGMHYHIECLQASLHTFGSEAKLPTPTVQARRLSFAWGALLPLSPPISRTSTHGSTRTRAPPCASPCTRTSTTGLSDRPMPIVPDAESAHARRRSCQRMGMMLSAAQADKLSRNMRGLAGGGKRGRSGQTSVAHGTSALHAAAVSLQSTARL